MSTPFSSHISREDLAIPGKERHTSLHPRVQRRMEVPWLIGRGLAIAGAARLAAAAALLTGKRHAALHKKHGLEGLPALRLAKRTNQRPAGLPEHPGGILSPATPAHRPRSL